jgi:hypothetical protein
LFSEHQPYSGINILCLVPVLDLAIFKISLTRSKNEHFMGIAITSWDKRGALGALTRSKNEPISDVRSVFHQALKSRNPIEVTCDLYNILPLFRNTLYIKELHFTPD